MMRIALVLCMMFFLLEIVLGAPKSAAQKSMDKGRENFSNSDTMSASQMSIGEGRKNFSNDGSKSASQVSMERDRALFSMQQKLAQIYKDSPKVFLERYFKGKCFSQGRIQSYEQIEGIVVEVSNERSIKLRWQHSVERRGSTISQIGHFETYQVYYDTVVDVVSVANVDTKGVSIGSEWLGYVTKNGNVRRSVQPIKTPDDLSRISSQGFNVVKYAAEIENKR